MYKLALTEESSAQLGKILFADILALGAIGALTNIVSLESLTKAVLHRVPAGTEEINKKALDLGAGLIKAHK